MKIKIRTITGGESFTEKGYESKELTFSKEMDKGLDYLKIQIIEGLNEFGLLSVDGEDSKNSTPLSELLDCDNLQKEGIRYLKFIPLEDICIFNKGEELQEYDWVLDLKKGRVYRTVTGKTILK